MGPPSLPFTKMHGCRNDYVVVDAIAHPVADPAALARAVSDRRAGVGADGLLLALPSASADLRMRMYNPDGSEAEMCGNGLRCLARFAADRGLVPDRADLRIETGAGVLDVRLGPRRGTTAQVTVDMGRPRILRTDEAVEVEGDTLRLTAVSLGNPHAVLFVADTEAAPVARLGAALEHHPLFPRRTNVEFAQVLSRSALRQRTWERGAGETLACGTGACAVAVASAVAGGTERTVTVHLRGGDLRIEWMPDDHVHLTGPTVEVFEGTWPGA